MAATDSLCDRVQIEDEYFSKAQIMSDESDTMSLACDPCVEDGKTLTAEGYCMDCNDFLCKDCFPILIKPKSMRHHALQDRKSMPHTKLSKTKETQNDLHCLAHHGQTVVCYCTTHDSVLCKLCRQFDHRQCKKQGKLINLNEVDLDTNQLTAIQCQIESLGEEVEYNKTISTQTGDNIQLSYADVVKGVKKIKESDLHMTKDISAPCESILLELVSIGKDLKRLSATEDKMHLFLKLKKAQTLVKTFECKLDQVRNYNMNFKYIFFRADQMYKNFCSVIKCPIETDTINIKTETDTTDCYITGIARLSEDKYVMTDYKNKKVKLVDLTSKTVTLEHKLNMRPHNVTLIDEQTIAIAAEGNRSFIPISIVDTMTVYEPRERCNCYKSITHINGDRVVCCDNQRHSFSEYCATFSKVKKIVEMFAGIRYISQAINTNTFYLTQIKSNVITRLLLNGKVLARFSHKYLKAPRGITCSRDGRVFVCSFDSHMIFEISSDLTQGKVILGEESGIF